MGYEHNSIVGAYAITITVFGEKKSDGKKSLWMEN
jgi:hypothetical protein